MSWYEGIKKAQMVYAIYAQRDYEIAELYELYSTKEKADSALKDLLDEQGKPKELGVDDFYITELKVL
jgi:hypothetical protein|tara:strand:- start:632 stop:835 length:204 start_codon:yes stop_codon:yes gene_type:complete